MAGTSACKNCVNNHKAGNDYDYSKWFHVEVPNYSTEQLDYYTRKLLEDIPKVKRTVSKWRLETDEEEPNPLFKNIVCCNCGNCVGANNLSTDYIYCPYCGSKNQ